MSPAVDRISNLPENVAEIILMHLPLSDAVRTSILSHSWRYRWNMIPQLVFDDNCISLPKDRARKRYFEELVKIFNDVLFVHHGPIHKFKLSTNSDNHVDMGRWILLLSRNGINEFTLEKRGAGYYKLPSNFHLCKELTDLRLFGCMITAPSVKGFGRLRTLHLCNAKVPNNELEILISLCPLLQIVVLRGITGCHSLNLFATNLVDLVVDVNFACLRFEKTPLLKNLEIKINVGEVVSNGVACKLSQIFDSLPKLEKLHLTSGTLGVLWERGTITELRTACNLRCLSVDVDFTDYRYKSVAGTIFESSPILQKLNVTVLSATTSNDDDPSHDPLWYGTFIEPVTVFRQLKIVRVTKFTGGKCELKFVEIVLASSPKLEKVQIDLKQNVGSACAILTEIVRFPRVSSKAEILFRA